ncbi:putative selenium-dependent hydroxylase accessory protein YqeC [Oscillibacter sp. MSJ-2]|uniref:Selenium-dependent hydroxylase accessory protein YqeC n=1 Tax=Dysosmobacter acutus TaxID=2841504 RepID=A0ABS6FAR0_9FIRM|nr:putative selenium-dependent hydroxylase accessory protein YqeC [Dysosmobacter acutus]
MCFYRVLDIQPGVTTVIGSGGKSLLLSTLGRELPGTVILCTTTRIYPIGRTLCTPGAEEVRQALKRWGTVCIGTELPNGKIGPPRQSIPLLMEIADYVIVEGDGAAGLPLKAHAPHEPVIPAQSGQIIQVVGFSGMGQTIREAAHRPERYAQLAGAELEDAVTPRMAAAVINQEGLCGRVLINQVDEPSQQAEEMASLLQVPAALGSLRKGWTSCLF